MAKVYDVSECPKGFYFMKCWIEYAGESSHEDGWWKSVFKSHSLWFGLAAYPTGIGSGCGPWKVIVEIRGDAIRPPVTVAFQIEDYGKRFVIWDEKPTEPYFKDGWPEWEVIGGEGSA